MIPLTSAIAAVISKAQRQRWVSIIGAEPGHVSATTLGVTTRVNLAAPQF